MTPLLESTDLDRFRDLVAQRFGLALHDGRTAQLAEVLATAMRRLGSATAAGYLSQMEAGRLPRAELAALAQGLTVGETHFFRHPDQFRALTESVLPELLQAQPARRRLNVLSLGCASGEEAYSLAIVVQDFAGCDASVTGVDVNPAALARAARGRFSEWSLRGLPSEHRQRYFRPAGKDHQLDESIRARVAFVERNLVEDDPVFWQPEAFDVVFCRNVLMYFTPEAARAFIGRVARSLTRGGFLFLGPAETLRGLSQDFHLRHSHDTFYYQRRRAGEGEPPVALPTAAWVPPLPAVDESWVDAIRRASERIASLGQPPPGPRPEAAQRAAVDLGAARELVRQERFDDALQALPSGHEADPDAQLLRAMILTNRGEVGRAEQLCREVLAGDELNAEAHYLQALCREHAGDLTAAIAQDQMAIYLDPEFAMPHLHIGLMHRRAGERESARQAFRQASLLLPREDASRVLLFGGGFSRESLLRLCQAELRACGDPP